MQKASGRCHSKANTRLIRCSLVTYLQLKQASNTWHCTIAEALDRLLTGRLEAYQESLNGYQESSVKPRILLSQLIPTQVPKSVIPEGVPMSVIPNKTAKGGV